MSHPQKLHLATPSHTLVRSNDTEEAALPLPPPPPSPPVWGKRIPWTEEEHNLFLQGLNQYGKGNWKKISQTYLKSRTSSQIASHAQKYYLRQNVADKRRSSIHDTTLEMDHPHVASSSSNLVTRQQQEQEDPNPNHHIWNQSNYVTTSRQQDPTHHNHHSKNVSPSPNHSYLDIIIKKSDEGHLYISVRDSNEVKVESIITLQGAPPNLDLSSQQVQIPYFLSTDLPPQHCRVTIKPISTQTCSAVTTDASPNSENVHEHD